VGFSIGENMVAAIKSSDLLKAGSLAGRLTTLEDPKIVGKYRKVLCSCSCGMVKQIDYISLIKGRSRSCGCLSAELTKKTFTTHGLRKHPIYAVWNVMRNRCNNPAYRLYKDYGGRGIEVCERWQKFENFYEDMGSPPFKGASIDRIDNDGPYSLENVRWATRAEQNRNKRNNRYFDYMGESKLLEDWAKQFSIKKATLASRLYLYDWPIEKALTTKVGGTK
jgi:hypothetical protein